MIPAHSQIGNPDAPHLAYVLHGVLGSGNNFRSFIKRLVERRPDYGFVLVDLRHHGGSLPAPPPYSLEACADDLFDLSAHLGRSPRAVIGHSLGGKVALVFGRRHVEVVPGERLADDVAHDTLRQIWALDSDPGAQEPDHGHQVLQVLAALKQHPGPFSSRNEALAQLQSRGLSSGLSQWLLTSLERTSRGLDWRFELDKISVLLEDYFARDLWPFLANRDPRRDGLGFELLVAEDSDRWSGNMRERATQLAAAGRLRLHVLPNAGHWVHVDNPTGLLDLLQAELA